MLHQQQKSSLTGDTVSVGVVTLLSRIFGLVRDSVIASSFGAGVVTDCFFVAFRIPNLVRRICADGAIAPLVVPELARCDSKKEIEKRLGSLLSLVLLFSVPPTVLAWLFPETVSRIFAPGFSADAIKLCADLLQIMIGYAVLIAIVAVLGSALNVMGRFVVPALSQVIFNLVLIAFVFWVAPQVAQPVVALSWAVIVGGILPLLLIWFSLYRLGIRISFGDFQASSARPFAPAVILSSATYQLSSLMTSIIASTLPAGSVSWLYYADRLFQFPLGVFVYALITAAFPELAKLAASSDLKAFSRRFNQVVEWLLFITVPASVGLIVIAEPLVSICFGRGSFSDPDVKETAVALQAFAFGLVAFSCQTMFLRAMQSKGRFDIPLRVGLITIALTLLLCFLLSGGRIYSVLATLDHLGLALAISIATWVSLVPSVKGLLKLGIVFERRLLASTFKIVFAALVMGGVVNLALRYATTPLTKVSLGVALGGVSYFLLSLALSLQPVRDIQVYLKREL